MILCLQSGVYNFTGLRKVRGKYVICRRPSLELRQWVILVFLSIWELLTYRCLYSCVNLVGCKSNRRCVPHQVWYNTTELAVAWDELLSASSQFHSAANYRHDLVDVTRQALQVLGGDLHNIIVSAFRKGNLTNFRYAQIIQAWGRKCPPMVLGLSFQNKRLKHCMKFWQ